MVYVVPLQGLEIPQIYTEIAVTWILRLIFSILLNIIMIIVVPLLSDNLTWFNAD